MKLDRRQFLQALGAGLAVAAMPATASLLERTAEATKAFGAEGWRFIVRGGSGLVGDSLMMLAPGVSFPMFDDWPGRTFIYPEVFSVEDLLATEVNRPITLMPWRPYRQQLVDLLDAKQRETLGRLTRDRP